MESTKRKCSWHPTPPSRRQRRVFKITSESIVHTCGNSGEQAFQGIAKLRAAAALEQLTAIHNERPDELRRMAREMAREGMAMLARTGNNAKTNIERIA